MSVATDETRQRVLPTLRPSLLSYGILLLAVLVLGSSSIFYPFGRDQGEYAAIAVEASQGKVVYRDVFNVKPPLTHVVHGMALVLFGHSMLAIRLLDLIWQCATVLLVSLLVERLFSNRLASVTAGLLYALSYYSFDFWNTAQTDGFLTLPVVAGVLLYTHYRQTGRTWLLLTSGASIGTAVLFKYPIGILFMLLLLKVVASEKSSRARAAVAITLGFALPIGAFLAVSVGRGAWHDFLLIQTTYLPGYSSGALRDAPVASRLAGLLAYLVANPLMLLPLVSVLVFWLLRRRAGWEASDVISLWWLGALLHLVAQNKFYGYHGLPLLAPGAILLACFVAATYERVHNKRRANLVLTSAVLLIIVGAWAQLVHSVGLVAIVDVVAGRSQIESVYSRYGPYHGSDYSVRADLEAAAYLRSHTDPADTVFVWGFEPTVYFLAQRRPASRFLYNFPLYGDIAWQRFREELMGDLGEEQPTYIVLVQNDAIPWVTGTEDDSMDAFAEFTALREFVSRHYTFDRAIEDFLLYARNPVVVTFRPPQGVAVSAHDQRWRTPYSNCR